MQLSVSEAIYVVSHKFNVPIIAIALWVLLFRPKGQFSVDDEFSVYGVNSSVYLFVRRILQDSNVSSVSIFKLLVPQKVIHAE